MAPAAFVRLQRSATGKLDARTLPAPEYALAEERPRRPLLAHLREPLANSCVAIVSGLSV